MQTRNVSHVSVVVGLAAVLVALWAGGAPLAGEIVQGIGGWGTARAYDGAYVACTSCLWNCGYCSGTTSAQCTHFIDSRVGCTGGTITAAICSSSPAGTTYGAGTGACWSSAWPIATDCDTAQDAWCD